MKSSVNVCVFPQVVRTPVPWRNLAQKNIGIIEVVVNFAKGTFNPTEFLADKLYGLPM